MGKVLTLAGIVLGLAVSAQAGDNLGGSMKCASATGRTSVVVEHVLNQDGLIGFRTEVVFTIDGAALTLGAGVKGRLPEQCPQTRQAYSATVFNPALRVFTLSSGYVEKVLEGVSSFVAFELVANPVTFKESKKNVYQFTALIHGLDPRNHTLFKKPITVNCTFDNSL